MPSLTNLLMVFEQATPQEVIEGLAWYDEAHKRACDIRDRYGVSLDVVAGVIGALSPRSRWDRNLADAERVIADLRLPETLDQDRDIVAYRSRWQVLLEELACNPWPTDDQKLHEFIAESVVSGRWRMNTYLIPGQAPENTFGRNHGNAKDATRPNQPSRTTMNTVICLVQKAD